MSKPRFVLGAIRFGVVAETVAAVVSVLLYSLKMGREPMEPPFNWTATMIQMPGILVAEWLGPHVHYSSWWQMSAICATQVLAWTLAAVIYGLWRTRFRA